jgi:hypothetical protein
MPEEVKKTEETPETPPPPKDAPADPPPADPKNKQTAPPSHTPPQQGFTEKALKWLEESTLFRPPPAPPAVRA